MCVSCRPYCRNSIRKGLFEFQKRLRPSPLFFQLIMGYQNRGNFNHSHVDFLGSPLHAERRRMHMPTNLPAKSEAACCTVCVFNTGAMWISTLCAGLLTAIGLSSESTALLCVCSALHGFACCLSACQLQAGSEKQNLSFLLKQSAKSWF